MSGVEEPILPAWLVMPMAGVTLLIIAAHLSAMQGAPMPRSRRTIRTANGLLMMVATPVIAHAFSVATTREPRTFVLVWTAAAWMLGLVILIALADVLNTWRLHHRIRRDLRRRLAEARRELLAHARR